MPGPKARAFRAKTMRRRSFLGPGGQVFLPPRTELVRCRGGRPGARWARLTKLRIVDCGMRVDKEKQKIRNPQSEIRNNWADAFCAKRPCLRATTLFLPSKENPKGAQALKKEASRKEIFLLFPLPLAESRSNFTAAWADFQNHPFLRGRSFSSGRLFPLRLLGLFLGVGPIAEEPDTGQHGED